MNLNPVPPLACEEPPIQTEFGGGNEWAQVPVRERREPELGMSIADPTGSGGKILSAGQAMRWQHGSKLFDAYDADGNGMMELTEFLPLLRKIEPDLSFQDIKYSFEAA